MANFDQFLLYAMGHSAFQYIYAACELSLFELVQREGPQTEEEIATRLKLERLPARCLLFGLTSLRLINQTDGCFSISEEFSDVVVGARWSLLKSWIRFQGEIAYVGQTDFLDSLRENTNVGIRRFPAANGNFYERVCSTPRLRATFFDYMRAWSAEAIPLLVRAVDFEKYRHIADVGGGDGTNAIAIANNAQTSRITLLDMPPVVELAEIRIQEESLTDRIEAKACNIFTDEFPDGIDCFLFVHQLVIWSPEDVVALLAKAFDKLDSGGTAIIFNSLADDSLEGPLMSAMDSAYFMSIPSKGGLIYTWQEYEDWLSQTGFDEITRLPMASWTPHGALVATKP